MTEQEFKRKYNDVEKLPTHIFSSRDLTKPVGKEFREYLLFLIHLLFPLYLIVYLTGCTTFQKIDYCYHRN